MEYHMFDQSIKILHNHFDLDKMDQHYLDQWFKRCQVFVCLFDLIL